MDLQSPDKKQTVGNQNPTNIGKVSHETEKETFILPFYKNNEKILKILSIISVITFFLPVGRGSGMFYTSLSSEEPSAVAVPLFVLLLTLCIVIFFKLFSNKTTYKVVMIISFINILLSLNLVLPTPYRTQELSVGSILVLLVSVTMFVCGKNALRFVKETEMHINCDINEYAEKEKEVSKLVDKHKLILKAIALIGMVLFFFPFAVTSCQDNNTQETGFDIMNHFSSGIGNMYAIMVFALFLLVFVTLFFRNKIFTAFSFIFGSVNVILLAMSKAVFGEFITKYLFGFYLCFVTALALSIGGFILYKKVRKAWGDNYLNTLKNDTKSIFIAIIIVLASLIIIVVVNNNINRTSISVLNSGSSSANSSNTEPTPSTPTPKYTFDEVVTKQSTYFIGGGDEFQVKSSEANYYGEITVGKRNYIDGASNDLQGTYALFVSDAYGGSAGIDIEFADAGFSYKNQFYGAKEGDAVKYPFDTNDIYSSLSDCHYNRNQSLVINNLSYLYIDWRRSQSVFSEKTFNMLAVVISKQEAVRYAQDGILPDCLQGLTVTGLDNIFKAPVKTDNTTTTSNDTHENTSNQTSSNTNNAYATDIPDAPESDFSYLSDASNTVQITGYLGKDTKVRIPNTIDGKPVTNIRQFAFFNHSDLEVVIIPEGVITIDDRAFASCTNLASITIPSSVTSIGEYAFAVCTKLDDASKRSILSIAPQMNFN